MLSIPTILTTEDATDYAPLLDLNERYGKTIDIAARRLDDAMIEAIAAAATKMGESSTVRVVEAIANARAGTSDYKVPRLPALPEIMTAYLQEHLIDGWVYKRGVDGHLHPWLVTDMQMIVPNQPGSAPYVAMSMVANGSTQAKGNRVLAHQSKTETFHGQEVARKRVADILTNRGIYPETQALRDEYDAQHERYVEILTTGFAEQYRYSGTPLSDDERGYGRAPNARNHAKIVHDLRPDEIVAPDEFDESVLFGSANEDDDAFEDSTKAKKKRRHGEEFGLGKVPTHFVLRAFDLATHQFLWVNTRDVERYVYDPTLADKIVLPADQRNLLNILTTNLDDFTGDVIEGKSAGNVILGKGVPGVGKTLTAEVYSEVIKRPLYSIHSGNLGINAADVRKNLEITFARAQRWNAVLLLDEADVFVLERGTNISQNAIVAEFLRTLEYFTGLMFMTTNRAKNIDDAILSRAAAIIDYVLPDMDDTRAVWEVQARNQGVVIPDDLLDSLVGGFQVIAPRDIKMLLRLAMRVAKGEGRPLDVDVFQRCSMFRGLHFERDSRTA